MTSPNFIAIQARCQEQAPTAALVLGSGLNEITDTWTTVASAPFQELAGFPVTSVAGHRGRLTLHELAGQTILVFQGRLHHYEGHDWETVALPVRLAHGLGARVLILTNASGGIGPRQPAGSLMAIRSHLTAMRPLWHRDRYEKFVYSRRLLEALAEAARESQVELPCGSYACVTGPNYETPAEVRAYRAAGADAVGMSTAHEATTAAELGMEVAAISCVANRAAGLSPTPLSHHEVLAMVRAAAGKMQRLLETFLQNLRSSGSSNTGLPIDQAGL